MKIEHNEYCPSQTNVIELCYYNAINLLKNYYWEFKPLQDANTVGVWHVKYKSNK